MKLGTNSLQGFACAKGLLLPFLLLIVISGCQSPKVAPAVENISSIQAYTDFCWYGQKLTKVEITYEDNVDLSKVADSTYTLLDRGYAHPDFAEAKITSIDITGQKVTLNITTDTEASADNTLNYIGDDAEGARTKKPIGLYATGPWYRAVDGTIHVGEGDTPPYKANTSRDGYQPSLPGAKTFSRK